VDFERKEEKEKNQEIKKNNKEKRKLPLQTIRRHHEKLSLQVGDLLLRI
jgi:hypothetical protein